MMKDNSKYVPYCLQHVIVIFDEIIPNILKIIENEFRKNILSSNETGIIDNIENQKTKDFSNLQRTNLKMMNSNFNYLQLILQILSTQSFKIRYLNGAFISSVFGFWDFYADNKLNTNKVI